MEVLASSREREIVATNGDIIRPGDLIWCGQWYGAMFYHAWRTISGYYYLEHQPREEVFVSQATSKDMQTMWRVSRGFWISLYQVKAKYTADFVQGWFEQLQETALNTLEHTIRTGPKNIHIRGLEIGNTDTHY